jgi:hypothetical protein
VSGAVERCHCGVPLHYSDPRVEMYVRRLVAELGPDVPITVAGRTWLVPRHYIALHGVKGGELSALGFAEVES